MQSKVPLHRAHEHERSELLHRHAREHAEHHARHHAERTALHARHEQERMAPGGQPGADMAGVMGGGAAPEGAPAGGAPLAPMGA